MHLGERAQPLFWPVVIGPREPRGWWDYDGMTLGVQQGDDRPSGRVLEQRVRNRVMEYLALAASYEEQQQHEAAAPIVHAPDEVINQWEDNFPRGLEQDLERATVYGTNEVEALRHVRDAWESACHAAPEVYPPLRDVQVLPEWKQLRRAAEAALTVFEERGVMPEDREVP